MSTYEKLLQPTIKLFNTTFSVLEVLAFVGFALLFVNALLTLISEFRNLEKMSHEEIGERSKSLIKNKIIFYSSVSTAIFILLVLSLILPTYSFSKASHDKIYYNAEKGEIIHLDETRIDEQIRINDTLFFTSTLSENIDGKPVFFKGLFRWRRGEDAHLMSKNDCIFFRSYRDKVYFIDSQSLEDSCGKLYRVDEYSEVEDLGISDLISFQIMDEYLYFVHCDCSRSINSSKSGLFRAKLDGSDKRLICFPISSPLYPMDFSAYNFETNYLITANSVVYKNLQIQFSGEKASGLEKFILHGNYKFEWIYYATNQLIKARPDGSEQIILDDSAKEYISKYHLSYHIDHIDDEWIYYYIGNLKYKIRLNGEEKTYLGKYYQ